MKRSVWFLLALTISGIAFAQWRVSTSVDEISGVRSCYAISLSVKPTRQMDFPYGDLVSWLGVGVKQKDEWGFIGFSAQPNLTGGEIGNGYSKYKLRVRWDDKPSSMRVFQEWGSRFLLPMDDEAFIKNVATHKMLIIEVKWFGQGNVYFKYPLEGAAKEIQRARTKCRN